MAIVDTAVHDFDVTRWLLGEEIAAIRVIAAKPNSLGGELQDPLLMILESESGVLVNVETSVNIRYGYDIRGEVVGETGTAALADRGLVVVRSANQGWGLGAGGLARPLHRRLRRGVPGVDQRGDRGRARTARARGTATPPRPSATPGSRPCTAASGSRSTSAPSPASTPDPAPDVRKDAMKVAIDPYMFRTTPLLELPGVVADLGFEHIELSPREDLTPFFLHPRIDDAGVKAFKKALDAAGVKVAAHLPLYRWSGPDEDERQAAVRYWKRAIQITVDLDCHVMNSEFNGRPEQASLSRGQVLEVDGGAAPGLRAGGRRAAAGAASRRLRRGRAGRGRHGAGINSPLVSFLYCAPHTFHMGGNMVEMMEYAGPLMTQLHLADAFDHTASSGLRYIVNPPGSTARVHQHLDIGQGEVDWDLFFATLKRLGFGDSDRNIMTACVFAWEDRARESSLFMREAIRKHTSGW